MSEISPDFRPGAEGQKGGLRISETMRSLPPFFKIGLVIAALAVVTLGFLPPGSAGEDGKTLPRLLLESGKGLISLDARDVEIAELLQALAEKTKTAITVGPGVSGKISVNISAATIGDVLKAIGRNTAIVYEYQPDTGGWRVLRGFAFSGSSADRPKSPAGNGHTGTGSGGPAQPAPSATTPMSAGNFAPVKPTPAQVTTSPGVGRETRPAYKAGELLVKFREAATPGEIAALHARLGSVVIRTIPYFRVQRIRLKTGLDEGTAITEYQKSAIVEYAERHALRYPQAIPNDISYSTSQWGMKKINAEALWDITTGNREIIVAVIDSGVDYMHPDLRDNIWVNTAELNGLHDVDDDPIGNVNDPDHIPYPDDIYGWDFAGATGAGDNDPMDSYGHGTHVAGIIGAVGNNGIGVTGLNWQVRIMPLKVMQDSNSSFTDAAILEALAYAQANGAAVVNCSFGGTLFSQAEYNAFNSLREKGIIVAVAAGNYGDNMDMEGKLYPACYAVDNTINGTLYPGLDNIISVANSNSSDTLPSGSNYGKTTVDVAAPGESIYSTIPLSGTTASVKTVDAAPAVEYPALGMEYAPLTETAGITGRLYDCGMGYSGYTCGTDLIDQIPDAVAGNIALIQRGKCDGGEDFYFSQKVQNAMARGAAGVIIYNNLADDDDDNFDTEGGTLGSPGNWIPAVSISKAAGEGLLSLLSEAPLRVALINKPTVNPYKYMSGTSMAAPHVAGLAGLILGRCPTIGHADIKAAIINSSDKIPALADKTASGGRINAFAALTSLFPPGDLSADCRIGLEDAILGMRILAGLETTLVCPLSTAACRLDTNGDGVIGPEEVIYILQEISGLRQ